VKKVRRYDVGGKRGAMASTWLFDSPSEVRPFRVAAGQKAEESPRKGRKGERGMLQVLLLSWGLIELVSLNASKKAPKLREEETEKGERASSSM